MTLRTYVRILRERWRLVALVMLVAIGLATLITALTSKEYEAEAQVLRSRSRRKASGAAPSPDDSSTYLGALLLRSRSAISRWPSLRPPCSPPAPPRPRARSTTC